MKYFLILLVFSSANTFAQSKIIFKEKFNNNKRHWKLQNDSDFVVRIDSGKLYIEKLGVNKIRNGCLWLRKAIPYFNTAKDFSITFFAAVGSLPRSTVPWLVSKGKPKRAGVPTK